MWAKVNAAQVQQQNWVDLMTIDMMQLSVLQTQMDNICLQATLITGFAIGMWAGETLAPFVEDDSQTCIWKQNSSLAFGHIFFMMVATCISCSVIIVSLISYIKQAAQEAALTVSTGAAIALTRKHLWVVTKLFISSIITFIISAMDLVILYVGLHKRIEYTESEEHEEKFEFEGIIKTWDGKYLIECINPHDPDANKSRDANGVAIATVNALIIFFAGCWGTWYFIELRKSYQPPNLIKWYVTHQSRMVAISKSLAAMAEPLGTGEPVAMSKLKGLGEGPTSATAVDDDSVSDA